MSNLNIVMNKIIITIYNNEKNFGDYTPIDFLYLL